MINVTVEEAAKRRPWVLHVMVVRCTQKSPQEDNTLGNKDCAFESQAHCCCMRMGKMTQESMP